MMKFRVLAFIAALLPMAVPAAEAPAMSSLDVSSLDSSLASRPLDAWLLDELGDDWSISQTLELTDCGEQNGASRQPDIPLCVEIKLESAQRTGYLYVVVGTYMRGIVGRPAFFFGVVDGVFLAKLSELGTALEQRQ